MRRFVIADPAVDVSVVVPTLDRADLLSDTLRDLSAQDFPPDRFEIIVVDDGSTDETPQVARAAAVTDESRPRLTYLQREHLGLNFARNLGVQNARGDLVAFLDDDVAVPKGWVRALVDGAKAHPESDCFAGRILLQLEGTPPRWCGRHPLGETELDLGDSDRSAPSAWGANMTIRRSAFAEVGTFVPELNHCGDEIEWQHRLLLSGGTITYLSAAWVRHRRTPRDLELRRMLRGRYRKGKAWTRLAEYLDRPMSVAGGLRHVLLGVGHAVRRLCWGGLLQAAFGWGHVVGAVRLIVTGEARGHVRWTPARRPR